MNTFARNIAWIRPSVKGKKKRSIGFFLRGLPVKKRGQSSIDEQLKPQGRDMAEPRIFKLKGEVRKMSIVIPEVLQELEREAATRKVTAGQVIRERLAS